VLSGGVPVDRALAGGLTGKACNPSPGVRATYATPFSQVVLYIEHVVRRPAIEAISDLGTAKIAQRRGCVSIRSIGDELIVQPARQVHLNGAPDGDDTLTAAMCQKKTFPCRPLSLPARRFCHRSSAARSSTDPAKLLNATGDQTAAEQSYNQALAFAVRQCQNFQN
jgi:hypothetical protein